MVARSLSEWDFVSEDRSASVDARDGPDRRLGCFGAVGDND